MGYSGDCPSASGRLLSLAQFDAPNFGPNSGGFDKLKPEQEQIGYSAGYGMIEGPELQAWAFLPLSPAPLSEGDWQRIVEVSGLPPQARPFIARAIAMYRTAEDARRRARTPAETRDLLAGASRLASALRNEIALLLKNPRAVVNLTLTMDPSTEFAKAMNERLAAGKIMDAIGELDSLTKWLSAAAKMVPKGRPGAREEKALDIQLLVHVLDRILLQFTGRGISRSGKKHNQSREYILAVCRLADPGARHLAIEDAMKRQIRSRGRIKKSSRR